MMMIKNSMQVCRKGTNNAGSLGGFFTFGGTNIYAISNNHVLANFNDCQVGDIICKAGSSIEVGTLQHWITLNSEKNYLDIALFKLAPGLQPSWNIQGSTSYPGKIRQGVLKEKVYMMTNNGSVKDGKITRLNTSEEITFKFSEQEFPFVGLTEVEPINGQPFSVEGESGSLVFSEGHNILGVLIGTLLDGSKSYYVPFINGNVGIKAVYNLQVWQP